MDDLHDEPADESLIAGIAERLRTAERLPDDFEARLHSRAQAILAQRAKAAARGVRPGRTVRWWRSPAVHLSPMATLLAAAGITAVATVATLAATRATPEPAPVGAVVHDTVHVLRFALRHHGARTIFLVGDFNGWKPAVTPLEPTGVDGMWTVALPLRPGRYEYAFLVDGVLMPDPVAPASLDEFDTESSVLMVTD